MSRLFYQTMQDNLGNLLFGVSGTMRLAGTGTLATIYGDAALTIPIANPMTNHPSFGSFKCYLGAGTYDFYMAKAGYTFETLTGVQGWGTMALQDADGVAITGGTVTGLSGFANSAGDAYCYGLRVGAATTLTQQGQLEVSGPARFTGPVGVQAAPLANVGMLVGWAKATQNGLSFKPTDSDTGNAAVQFLNLASGGVGSITTTNTATAYNTTSDSRLKEDVEPLTGALDVVQALNPVAFRWRLDGSPGRGFLADEVQEVIPDGVVTGDAGALDADGQIQPQMIDYSKLVPYLIGAVKELTEQVQALTAKLESIGALA